MPLYFFVFFTTLDITKRISSWPYFLMIQIIFSSDFGHYLNKFGSATLPHNINQKNRKYMKTKSFKTITASMMAILAVAVAFLSSCSGDNKVEPLAASTNTGTDVINASIGAYVPTTYTTPGAWKGDKSHSSVKWETKYYDAGAMLTGRFNNFNVKINFDQVNPANTKINAWVQLSTFNTGEPGRDAYGKSGCNYMGVKFDTIQKTPSVVLAPQVATDTAWFNSTSCKKYGTGYMVTGNFIFRGKTIVVDMPMTYTGIKTATNTTTGKKTDRAGFYGKFPINALTVFGVPSTSIADVVNIIVDWNCVTLPY